ncbi:MAG: M48 family metallopeptidase [Verrucomicrobiota bacterium]
MAHLSRFHFGRHARRLAVSALATIAVLGGLGCQTHTEPGTGRSQFILTSPGQETTMGLQAWKDIVKEETESTNRELYAAVRRVGKAIAQAANKPDFKWEFRLFKSKQANAFCLPGGKIAVYEGLFKYIDNDAELAAVMGHEVAHATARHGGERMTQAMLMNFGAMGVSAALKDETAENRERWLAAYTGVTTVGVMLPYSRTHEYSADRIGLMYMAKAGYAPEAAIDFWKKFARQNKTPALMEFLSTHPVGEKRIEQLQQFLPKAKLEYEVAPRQRGFGQSLN